MRPLLMIFALAVGLGAGRASTAYLRKTAKEEPLRRAVLAAANAAAWLLAAWRFAPDAVSVALAGMLSTLLLLLAVIDAHTFTLPNELTLAVALLGAVRVATDAGQWPRYVLGALCVSVPFLFLWVATRGEGLGLGDVKLMAGSGLLLGWQRTLLAVLAASVLGSVLHLARMRRGAPRRLAFGPYLAAGVWLAALFGDAIIAWYLSLLGL